MNNSPNKTRDSETVQTFRALFYSRYKLLDKDIPMQLRATSYLRISCTSFKKLNDLELFESTAQLQDIQFSFLLKSLTKYDSCWWKKCTVSNQGILKSEDSAIKKLLEPLINLHVYCCSIK
jgi:hypothetical protein